VLEGMGFASFIRAAAEQTERLDRLFPRLGIQVNGHLI
jgi:hypothetical protein